MVDNEENMDLDSLQAQIDMSMSFAQDLVSSWIQPSKVATTSRSHELEKELKEYMRRPPRLGVGAPMPETNGLSREAARLKGRLQDKMKLKRASEEDQRASESDSQEESKAKLIKKKAKLDPFVGSKKKFKRDKIPQEILAGIDESLRNNDSATERQAISIFPVSQSQDAGAARAFSTAQFDIGREPSISTPPASIPPVPKTPETALPHPRSPFASSPRTTVLNLDGPPSDERDETEHAMSAGGQNQKKKRRRRKRRKRHPESKDGKIN